MAPMAAKRRMSSGRTARSAVTKRGGGDADESAEEDMPGAAEKAVRDDGGRGARQPDEDVGMPSSQSDRARQEHCRESDLEAGNLWIASHPPQPAPPHPAAKP